MKKGLLALLLMLVLAAGVVWAGSDAYFGFASQTIYEESTAHLVEILR